MEKTAADTSGFQKPLSEIAQIVCVCG